MKRGLNASFTDPLTTQSTGRGAISIVLRLLCLPALVLLHCCRLHQTSKVCVVQVWPVEFSSGNSRDMRRMRALISPKTERRNWICL